MRNAFQEFHEPLVYGDGEEDIIDGHPGDDTIAVTYCRYNA